MRVLVYSYFPPLADHQYGGAQRALDGLLRGLDAAGLQVALVSPSARGQRMIDLPGVEVTDRLLAVELPDASARARQQDLRLLDELTRDADVLVTVDRHFPLLVDRPVVLWLNNFSYGPETAAAFGLNWDAIVVPSDHARDCVAWYFGPHAWHGRARPVHAIPHGVAIPAAPSAERRAALRVSLGIPPSGRYLVFPHRPDPAKGFDVAVAAVRLVRDAGHDMRLLVPEPPGDALYPPQRAHVGDRRSLLARRRMTRAVIFHRWLAPDEMPAYFGLAEWTLCLSTLDETFGFVALESVAAGVPVVATPAGAIAQALPPAHGVDLVEFNDPAAVAAVIERGADLTATQRGRDHMRERNSWDRAADAWIEVLRSARKSDATFRPTAPADSDGAPWIRRLPSGRVWHPLRGEWRHAGAAR